MFFFCLSIITKKFEESQDTLTELIIKAKSGDTLSREHLLKNYRAYVLSLTSKITGKFINATNSDEYSIALSTFNESIDLYIPEKNTKFLSFASQRIKWRLLEYIKNNSKHNNTLPFSYFDDKEYTFKDSINNYCTSHNEYLRKFGDVESKDEIQKYQNELAKFGITLQDMVKNVPKHHDSRLLCIKLANIIIENDALYKKMLKSRNIPRNELVKLSGVHRRTIENNRKYIIAICLILKSDLELAKTYVKFLQL